MSGPWIKVVAATLAQTCLRNRSGSLAMFAAMRRASSFVDKIN